MPMWAWIAALAGGGLVIGGAVYVLSQQNPPVYPDTTPAQAAGGITPSLPASTTNSNIPAEVPGSAPQAAGMNLPPPPPPASG